MRKRIFEIIDIPGEYDILSRIYDILMIIVIFLSLVPLAFKQIYTIFRYIEVFSLNIFLVDYLLRWGTADYKFKKNSAVSFLRYPFSVMAIIDLLSILPSITFLNSGFLTLRVLRLVRSFRVFRIFKAIRYSKNIVIIINVLKKSRDALVAVCVLAIGYIIVSALVIFNVEPDSFNTFFDAIYWATVSLTTMGYGDIYPVTTYGRVITMLSSFIGIAIVALPAGIITADYMKEIEKTKIN